MMIDSHHIPNWLIGICAAILFVLLTSFIIHRKIRVPFLHLAGKHVVITGGSSGIGLEIAKECIRQGADVTIIARNVEKLIEATQEISRFSQKGAKCYYLSADLGKGLEEAQSVINKCYEFRPVDVLVNCAGLSIPKKLDNLTESDIETMLRVNLLGSIYPTKAILPEMKKTFGFPKSKNTGRIVFVSSQAGQVGIFGFTAYSASKYALRGFAEALDSEVKPYNLYVSVVFPPDTDTPGLQTENQIKPEETKLISSTSGLFTAEEVAKSVVKGFQRGTYSISVGFDGWMLSQLTAGMSPVTSILHLLSQVCTVSIFRLVAFGYRVYFDWIISSQLKKQRPSS